MTHPDIVKMEKFGELYPREESAATGRCLYCGELIYGNDNGYVQSIDGMFCCLDCCHEYYEIQA